MSGSTLARLSGAYGVSGLVVGTSGVGVYGGTGTVELPVSGLYAGYFSGNVKVTGLINGTTIPNSDIRYKKDVLALNPEKSLNNVLMMKPVEYRLEQQYAERITVDSVSGDEIVTRHPVYDEKSEIFQNRHYGLIAQELQKLYPDLVYTLNEEGYLGVNYVEIIPMLIQSVQELNRKIETLENKTPETMLRNGSAAMISPVSGEAVRASSLEQNIPNPFNQNTSIRYYLLETVATAYLCFYDLQGKQLKQITLSGRGEGSQTVQGSQFSPGIYLYALIADGQEVDVKRMILTE